ncbi:MAG: hemerythrin domain-containing protein [Xanthobacteraceae bacterium]
MTRMIELLRGEHRDIEQLLNVLEDELKVFDRRERPDYEVIQAIISYFQDYPDCCHHPKEDMIFDKLKVRNPPAAKRIGDVEAEHRQETERLDRVARVVRNVLLDREIARQTFSDVMRDFIDHQRVHMAMEERTLFPAAANALRPEDWQEIESKWNDKTETLFNVAMEEKCHSLRDRILRWGRENNESRFVDRHKEH